ncbi:MAG: hypothetical protein HUK07_01725, partial [Bacteroidaceae bacterium]|nr:hypothetical protein [Bacteroidaceae bacterium]
MYDKIKLCLSNADAQEIIPPKLENAKEQVNIKTGEIITFGGLQGLKVCVFSWGITIEGSLAKFLLPNNIYTLNRTSTQEAIEKLCDLLGLNIGGANVAALEYGTNFVMSKPVGVYLDKLGECGRLIRLPVANTSLY